MPPIAASAMGTPTTGRTASLEIVFDGTDTRDPGSPGVSSKLAPAVLSI